MPYNYLETVDCMTPDHELSAISADNMTTFYYQTWREKVTKQLASGKKTLVCMRSDQTPRRLWLLFGSKYRNRPPRRLELIKLNEVNELLSQKLTHRDQFDTHDYGRVTRCLISFVPVAVPVSFILSTVQFCPHWLAVLICEWLGWIYLHKLADFYRVREQDLKTAYKHCTLG